MNRSEPLLLFSLLLVTVLIASLFLGFTWLGLATGLAAGSLVYSVLSMRRLRAISAWLQKDISSEPPESKGEWGELLDGLYRLRKGYLRQTELLEQHITHLQNSFASLDDAVVLLNSADEIDWCNDAAGGLLGLSYPQDQGQQLMNLLRDPMFVTYYEEGEYGRPLSMMSPQSDSMELELLITWFGTGNRMLFVRDVSDVRRLERTRSDFVANVSHELRTPLTVISGYIETMLGKGTDWQPALEQMAQQAHRMEALLADLTQLNKLESVPQKSQDDVLDIRSMISMIFDEISVRKPDQKLKLKIKTDAGLLGSHAELYSAFSNLIHNASKYSPDDGKISISWSLDATGASLAVNDSGIGIEAQHLPRLTERFYRADHARHSSTGGTGLGLAIVKHVLLRHQAALEIDSTPGMGSTFICHFPEQRLVRKASD